MIGTLTPDNPPLSDLTVASELQCYNVAINFTLASAGSVEAYVRDSLSENTRRAYQSDLAQFLTWGGMIPATPETIAAYLAAHATVLKPASLTRHLASIAKAHRAKGLPSPTTAELVKAVLSGIRRSHGQPQASAKPLLRDDLFMVLDSMGNRLKDVRDRALLLIGFAGGFRRSELIGLDTLDLQRVRQGAILTLRRSKTDQTGQGRKIGIPLGRTRHCPVIALENWLKVSGITDGPIFRPINRHGQIDPTRLSDDSVCRMLRQRVELAGIEPAGYSGHSLRAGFATSAAMAGISSWKIRQQTGHASDAMLARYVRAGQLFEDNAAGHLL